MYSCAVLLLPVANDPTLDASTLVFQAAIGMALLAGIVKCLRIMRRPTTSAICVLSLTALLFAFLVVHVVTVLSTLDALPLVWRALLTFLAAAFVIIALVLSIQGLVEVGKRPGEYQQGQSQARWALTLSLLCLTGLGYMLWHVIATKAQEQPAKYASARSLIDDAAPIQFAAPERFEEFNFSFHPSANWMKVEASAVNPDATAAYVQPKRQVNFVIIAERPGMELGITAEALAASAKVNAGKAGNPTFSPMRAGRVGGIECIHFDGEVAIGPDPIKLSYTIAAHLGFCFQLISHGLASESDLVSSSHAQMIEGFALVDPDAVAHGEGYAPFSAMESDKFGYGLDLSGEGWAQGPDAASGVPGAEVALHFDAATLAVLPVCLPQLDISFEDLAQALLQSLFANVDEASKPQLQSIEIDGTAGAQFTYAAPNLQAGATWRFRLFKRGQIAYVLAGFDENARSGVDYLRSGLIERAFAGFYFSQQRSPENDVGLPSQRAWRAQLLNELGVIAFGRREFELAEKCFREAVALDSASEPFLCNLALALSDAGKPASVLEELEPRLDKFPQSFQLAALQARSLAAVGRDAEARGAFEDLFARGHRNEDDLWELIRRQLDANEVDAALAAVDKFLERGGSRAVRVVKAQLLTRRGDFDAAIELLLQLNKAAPADGALSLELALAYESAGRYAQAINVASTHPNGGVDDAQWKLLVGRCQLGLKWHRQAKESFQAVLALDPKNAEARELLTFASGLLGQGDATGARTAIEPVAIPQAVHEAMAAATWDGLDPSTTGIVERYRVTGYHYEQGKSWKKSCYRLFKVHSAEGVNQLSSVSIYFDPLVERVHVNQVVVSDLSGKRLAAGDPDEYYVRDVADDPIASTDRTLNVPIPQVKTGAIVELVYTVERVSANQFGFEEVMFSSINPAKSSIVFVIGEVDKVASRSKQVKERTLGQAGRWWQIEQPLPISGEPSQAPLEEFMPIVTLSDNEQTWEEIARDSIQYIESRLTPDETVAARSRELTAQAADDKAKIETLVGFMQREIAYRALEFGVRGQLPNTAGKTLSNAYGDCKDHAVLLKQLLNAVGIPAELALVRTGGAVAEDLPSADQFDHMLVYLPDAAEGSRFVDCTSKFVDARLPPARFLGRKALILDKENPRLLSLSGPPAPGMSMHCEREVKIALPKGDNSPAGMRVTESLTIDPLQAESFRSLFVDYSQQERREMLLATMRHAGDLELEDVQFRDLDSPSRPLIIEVSYVPAAVLHRTKDGAYMGSLPIPWESWWLEVSAAPNRTSPFNLRESQIAVNTTVKAPAGFIAADPLSAFAPLDAHEFARYQVSAFGEDKPRIFTVSQPSGTFAPERYATYYREARTILEMLRRPIRIEPKP